MPPIIGIDLGTTNGLMTYVDYRTGLPRVIPDRRGQILMPSVDVASDRAYLPFTALSGERTARLLVGDREITVPAYFDESQRQATRDAGRIAGLEVMRLLNEPIAAALAYGLQRLRNGVIAIYDLGGGTFDISLLRVTDGVFEVLATNGHTRLGGDDFDRALVEFLLEEIRASHGTELAGDRVAMQQLRLTAEAAKRELSNRPRATVRILFEEVAYCREITRAEFEDLIAPFVDGTLIRCRMALLDAGLAPADVDEVVLVGGSTRVPLVQRRVESLFGRPAHSRLDPDQVVAMGAAVEASILEAERADMLVPSACVRRPTCS